jgi:hypothetical protein
MLRVEIVASKQSAGSRLKHLPSVDERSGAGNDHGDGSAAN